MLAQSEPYPNRPVRMIAPAGPGGNPDVMGRLLAAKFTDTLGKPFVVENMPGAGGVVAANVVAKAPPDGHVLMLADSGALAINPALHTGLSYDPLKDFVAITAIATLPTAFVVPPSLPVKTPAEFIALAKKDPGKLTLWLGRSRLDPSHHHGGVRRPRRHRHAAHSLPRRHRDGERAARR